LPDARIFYCWAAKGNWLFFASEDAPQMTSAMQNPKHLGAISDGPIKDDVVANRFASDAISKLGTMSPDARELGKHLELLVKGIDEGVCGGGIVLGDISRNLEQVGIARFRPHDAWH
jgi:hypothetical protein